MVDTKQMSSRTLRDAHRRVAPHLSPFASLLLHADEPILARSNDAKPCPQPASRDEHPPFRPTPSPYTHAHYAIIFIYRHSLYLYHQNILGGNSRACVLGSFSLVTHPRG